jgi:cardiolipin synthase
VVVGYIPNLLTVLRIAAAPVLMLLLKSERYDLAFVVFLAAGFSDGLDGFIAKRFNCETRLGAVLDPIADKLLLVTSFVMLTLLGQLPFWLLVTVVFRDLLIVGGYLVLAVLHGSVQMRPTTISKINTLLQIILVAAVLVQAAGWVSMPWVTRVLIVTVTVTTVWSGIHYVWVWGLRGGQAQRVDS